MNRSLSRNREYLNLIDITSIKCYNFLVAYSCYVLPKLKEGHYYDTERRTAGETEPSVKVFGY